MDDNATNREVLENILNNWNINEINSAEGPIEALNEINSIDEKSAGYDFILLDMQMPKMDGVELAKIIRKNKYLNDTKLVMLSSVDSHQGESEVDAWLSKPVRQSDLFNTLMMLLGRHVTPVISPKIINENLSFPGCQLLLVEDNEVNQQVAYELLKDAGFDIDIRDNGKKAVQAVQDKEYDVVLMDIQMPVMDGLDAAKHIRALGGKYSTLPIIAMTAHALIGDSDKSISAGMNAHVTKPIDPDHVLSTIADWVVADKVFHTKKENEITKVNDSFPDLPGINTADGLRRLRGNSAAYKRILISFLNKQANSVETISNYIDNNQWEEAVSLSHTLKGSGGNIGAEQLHINASALEQACRAKNEVTAKSFIKSLDRSLQEVVMGLHEFNKAEEVEDKDKVPNIALDKEEIHTLLERLMSLLDDDIGEAQELVHVLAQKSKASELDGPVSLLVDSLNSFDIDTAKIETQKIINLC